MGDKFLNSSFKNLVVLLIDMQKGFINSDEKRDLIPNQILVIQFCKEKKIPLGVIEYEGEGKTISILKDEIDKIPSEIVFTFKKDDDDAFYSSDFKNWLIDIKAETLLLMGINACACIFDTANSAVENGYKIITSDDLIAGYCRPECEGKHSWYSKNGTHSTSIRSFLGEVK